MLQRTVLDQNWRVAAGSWLPLPKRIGFSQYEWLPAEVPGHVHLDLVRAGVIADPLTQRYELGSQWIDEEDWHFETEFAFHPDAQRPRRVLHFEGLDTVATVWLNGECIGEHDDMFVPLDLDVGDRLVSGNNTLRVEFRSALVVGRERRRDYLAQEGLPDDVERFDERAFVRKAQYMYGWDWGPRLVSAGIWRPVELVEFRGRITHVRTSERHEPNGDVTFSAQSRVDGPGRVRHTLSRGEQRISFDDGTSVCVEQPALWWPLGMGEPALYTLTTELLEDDRVLDRRSLRVGFRQIELVQEPDEHGTSFGFVVNGRPLWALGANWIPDHSFPSQVDRERTFAAIARARDVGTNMLRVWGGGLYESDDFYDACDEQGILVWQDFPFACNYAPDDAAARAVMRAEASVAIERLRHRASLAIWCGNNENRTMFESKWGQKDKHPPRYQGEHIWEGTLPELLQELDPERPYVSSSPIGGPLANADEAGDQHYWDVWHGRGDWRHYADSRGRFVSEFGFASAPGRVAWREALTPRFDQDTVDLRHPIARWHDKTAKGYETFIGYVELHYPRAHTLAEWSYYSQLNQRDALRFALEHHRAGTFCSGALIWQLNDCWPVQSWALFDSAGEYKAAAYELRRVFAPALAAVFVDDARVRVVAILDNVKEPRRVRLSAVVTRTTDGSRSRHGECEVSLEPGERKPILELDVSGLERREALLTVTLDGVTSARLLCEPKDARLQQPQLCARVLDGAVEISSAAPVIDLFLWTDEPGAVLRDNFLTLHEPGSLRFRCSGSPQRLFARSVAGLHEVVLDAVTTDAG